MNKKANKKNLAGRFLVAGFFVLLFSFSLLMVSPAQALNNVYNKLATSTLSAFEWNNLLTDFISTNGGRIDGPLSINTATSSSYALDIVGSIRATNLSGSFSGFLVASNVSMGNFGSNSGGGNYTFPANLGIGTTNTGSRLFVYDDVAQSPRDANTAIRIETPNASGAPGTTGGQITFAQPYLTGNASIIRTGAIRGIKTLASGNYGGGLQLLYAPIGDVDMAAGLTLNHLGNVGIGTTGPEGKLHVQGQIYANMGLSPTDMMSPNAPLSNEIPVLTYKNGLAGGGLGTDGNGTTYISSYFNAAMRSNGGVVFLNQAGNVGIGTTNPQSALHVQSTNVDNVPRGDIILGKYWASNSDTRASSLFHYYDSSQPMDKLVFGVAGTGGAYGQPNVIAQAKMVIQANGNVGIGTTTPTTARLVVTPSGNYSIDALGGRIGNITSSLDTDAASVAYVKAVIAGTSTIPTVGYWTVNGTHIYSANSGGVGIGITNPGIYKLNVNGDTNITGTLTATTFSGSYAGTINSANVSAGNFAANTGLGNFSFPGNVGIGTTALNDTLQVKTTGQGSLTFGGTNGRQMHAYDSAGNPSNFDMLAASTYFSGNLIVGGQIQSPGGTNGNIVFAPNGTGNNIFNNGNVGINTTDPGAYRLNVNGNTNITGTLTATTISGSYSGTINAPNVSAGEFAANTAGGNFIFGNTVGGNVGIGTANPHSKLSIKSYNWQHGLEAGTVSPEEARLFYESDGTGYGFGIGRKDVNGANYADYMYIKDGGSVGIGTTAPENKLHIEGSVTIDAFGAGDETGLFFRKNISGAKYNLSILAKDFGGGSPDGLSINAYQGVAISTGANSYTPRLFINNTGNVGVGTTAPLSKFDIVGISQIAQDRSSHFQLSTGTGVLTNEKLIFGVHDGDYSWIQAVAPNVAYRNLVLNAGGGNVGIGTTTPTTAKLVINPGGLTYAIDAGGARIGPITSSLDTDAASVAYVKAVIAGTSTIPTVGYWTANGTNISNANSGNVGIGTAVPGTKLEVNSNGGGVGGFTAFKVKYGTASVQSLTIGQVTAGNGAWIGTSQYRNAGNWQTEGTAGSVINFAAGGEMSFSTNASLTPNTDYNLSERMRITSDGNVGINITNPGAYRLNVNGDTNITGNINVTGTITGGGAYVGTINAGNVSAGAFASNTGLGNFSFPGNVGIGTTAPDAKLRVEGLVSVNGEGNGVLVDSGAAASARVGLMKYGGYEGMLIAGNATSLRLGHRTDTAAVYGGTPTIREDLVITSTGNVGIGTVSPSTLLDVGGVPTALGSAGNVAIRAGTNMNLVLGGSGTGGTFFIRAGLDNNTNYSSLTIQGNPLILNPYGSGQNVGIGTTAPNAALDVTVDGGQPEIKLMRSTGEYGASIWNNWSGTNDYLAFGVGHGTAPNLNEKMRILDSGNVGINITNPGAYRLNVNGDTNITGALNVTGTITGGGAYTGTINAANVSAGTFAANTGGGNFGLLGNMGVGIAVPTAKFQVHGGDMKFSSVSNGYLYFGQDGLGTYMEQVGNNTSNENYRLQSSKSGDATNYSQFIIDPTSGFSFMTLGTGNGNVGIGTTIPYQKLDVRGTIAFGDISGYAAGFLTNVGSNTAIQTNGAGTLVMYTSNAERMRIDSAGNVGINTTAPTEAKLVINAGTGMALKAYGNAIFTGTVQTQTGSDFAEEFATPYDLEAGTVVVMDEAGYKSVKPSTSSYDKTVVGIVSNNPSIIAGRVESKYKAIVAMMGVVKVKVTGANGKIYKGDMLTTADREGYAMKADSSKPGTIIGKALENLTDKTGEINVLVNLQ